MKKRFYIVLFGLTLTLFVTAACGQKNDGKETASVSAETAVSSADTSADPARQSDAANSSAGDASVSLPVPEEATFLSDKDYTNTLVQRYIDVHKLSDKTKQYVVDILNGDTLTIDISGSIQIAQGISTQFSGIIAADGDKRYMKTDIAGRNTVMLRNESGTYTLNEERSIANKTSQDMDSAAPDTKGSPFYQNTAALQLFTSVMAGFGQEPLTYVQSGAEVFEGKPLTYEEYAVGRIAIKLYYDGNALQYVTLDKDSLNSVITIHTLTDTADAALFRIPDGYTIQ